jgi:hypothetical protein
VHLLVCDNKWIFKMHGATIKIKKIIIRRSFSREADSSTGSQEISHMLCNSMFITALSRGRPLSLSSPRWFYSQPSHSRRFVWILSSHLCLGLPSLSFLIVFSPKPVPDDCHIPHTFHLHMSDLLSNIIGCLFFQVCNKYNIIFL